MLPLFVCSLGVFAAASFVGLSAAQIGIANATRIDRGAAMAVYFSAYYAFGAVAGYVPGLLWERAGWTGTALLSLGITAVSIVTVLATGRRARAEPTG